MTKTTDTKSATAKVEEFAAEAQKSMSQGMEKATKGVEEITAFGQGNVDALTKSAEIATKAAEKIGADVTTYSRKSFEDGVAAAQDFASAKTVTELMEKQTAFAQTAFDAFVKQATAMNTVYTAAAKDVTAPINARVTAAVGSMKSFSA